MSVVQVPNLPSAIALNGTEQYEAVQAGVSVKVTTAQIATFAQTQYPAPGVSAVVGSGPISTTGTSTVTVSLQTAGVTNAYLATMNARTVKANVTGSPAQPSDVTVSQLLDVLGAVRGDILYRGAAGWTVLPPASTAGYVLTNNGTSTDPSWGLPSTFSSLTVSTPLSLSGTNISLTTVPATLGGTGQSVFAVGDLLYADTTTSLAKLADAATGNALISGGIGIAPSYGKIGLTTHVSGTLGVTNGGSGQVSFTSHGVLYGSGTAGLGVTVEGATGQVLIGNTGGAPSWAALSSFGVSTISFGTTGLTPNSATSGAVTVAGTLATANGGTALTGFTAANNAIYSTSSSVLTAGTLPILAGGTGSTTATGSGSVVLATSPTLVTPTLGVATATTINKVALTAPATGSTLTIADGKTLTASNTLTFTGADGSSVAFGAGGTLQAVAYSGSAADLGSGTLPSGRLTGSYTGITGVGTLTAGVWHGTVVGVLYGGTGANLSATGGASQVLQQTSVGGVVTVAQLAASDLSNGVTGSGAVILATSPVLVTPTLGVATATTINGVTITAPASGSTLTIANGKTFSVSASLTLAGSDGTSFTFPGSGMVLTADSTAALTNKTYDTAGTGNVLKIAGVGISAVTGTGSVVLSVSPALTGNPTAPTQSPSDASTNMATTRYVDIAIPAGAVIPYAGSAAPSGWLLCFGQSVLRTDYANLFTAIGTTFGSADGTHFTLPDMRGRLAAGVDNMGGSAANRLGSGVTGGITGAASLAASGGTQSHTLTVAQLASHTHTIAVDTAPTSPGTTLRSDADNTAPGTKTSNSTGGDTAHNNTQPTLVLNYIIKF